MNRLYFDAFILLNSNLKSFFFRYLDKKAKFKFYVILSIQKKIKSHKLVIQINVQPIPQWLV